MGATIASITDSTHFELSASTTGRGSLSSKTLTFGSYIATDTSTNPNTLTMEQLETLLQILMADILGKWPATEGSSSTWKIVLMDKARKTNGNDYFAGTLFSLGAMRTSSSSTDLVTAVSGHGKEDSFAVFDKEIQMLKSAVMYGAGGQVLVGCLLIYMAKAVLLGIQNTDKL